MDGPLDLSVTLTQPPQGSRSGAIASFNLRCDKLGLGPVEGLLIDPLTARERKLLRTYLEEYWEKPETFDQLGREAEELLPDIGKRLYKQVFEGRNIVRDWLSDHAPQRQISILSDIARVLNLPWELLHDEQGYLALRTNFSIVRRVPKSELFAFPLPFEPPLRILLVTARPEDKKFVDPRVIARELLDEVEEHIEAGEIDASEIKLEFLRPPTLDALRNRLSRSPQIHVLHFDGHGTFDSRNKQGTLSFEYPNGQLHPVESDTIAQVLLGSDVKLMVMTACQSAEGSVDDVFSSVAARLVQAEINAVVAMSASILVSGAVLYAEAFYRSLVIDHSVLTAQGKARQALYSNKKRKLAHRQKEKEGRSVDLDDWWVPHFYLQRSVVLAATKPVRKVAKRTVGIAVSRLHGMPFESLYHFNSNARELLRIERFLVQNKLVVVHGQGGIGKTAFVCEAADWLTRTGMFTEAYFVSFKRDGEMSLSQLERLIPIQEERRRGKKENILVIADSVESVLPGGYHALDVTARAQLWKVLRELVDKNAGVILTTTNTDFGDGRLAQGKEVRYLSLESPDAAKTQPEKHASLLDVDYRGQ